MNKSDRIGSVNQGYKVLYVAEFKEFGVALCERVSKVGISDYVVWRYRVSADDDYFWGHYCSTFANALDDFQDTIMNEMDSSLADFASSYKESHK